MFAALHSFDAFFYNIAFKLHESAADAIITPIATAVSFLGDNGLIWILLALVLLLFKKTRKIGVVVCAAIALDVVVVNGILKVLIDRPRPWVAGDFPIITRDYVQQRLISIPGDSSFPSGHTASAFAAATGLVIAADKKRGFTVFAVILAFMIAASRIYVCVHYPSDVFAGLIVGIILGIIAYFVVKAIYNSLDKSGKFPKLNSVITGEKWGI